MAKDEIEKIFGESKDAVSKEHASCAKAIRKSLNSFKKKTLAKV